MKDYRAQTPATEPPVLPLSTQMRVAAEMAAPEIRGLAEMIGTEWQAEALRLEGAVSDRDALLRYIHENDATHPDETDGCEVCAAVVAALDAYGG